MMPILGVDVGTSTIKLTCTSSEEGERVISATPDSAAAIAEHLREIGNTGTVALSTFRRATVIDGRLELVRDRATRNYPHDCQGDTARNMTFSPASCFPAGTRFELFEGWLMRELCGEAVVSQRAAWLSGIWDRQTRTWCPDCLGYASLRLGEMPLVTDAPTRIGGWVAPIYGDHEATIVSMQRSFPSIGALLELGTASASFVSKSPSFRGVNVLAASGTEPWSERVDPTFAQRLRAGEPVDDLLRPHIAHLHDAGQTRVVISGGNTCESAELALRGSGLEVLRSSLVGSSVGARIGARRLRESGGCSLPLGAGDAKG